MTAAATQLLAGMRLLAAALPGSEAEARPASPTEAERIRRREPGAWRVFYEDAREGLYRYAYSRLGSAEDAEDLVAQVFEAAWEQAPKYEDRGLPARAWLFGIARNLVRMRRRSLLRRPPILALEAFDDAHADSRLDAGMLDLAQGIRRLPRDLGEVVTLRFLHGLTAEEVADVLRVPVPTVKSRQFRALTQLREWLGAEPASGPSIAAKAAARGR